MLFSINKILKLLEVVIFHISSIFLYLLRSQHIKCLTHLRH